MRKYFESPSPYDLMHCCTCCTVSCVKKSTMQFCTSGCDSSNSSSSRPTRWAHGWGRMWLSFTLSRSGGKQPSLIKRNHAFQFIVCNLLSVRSGTIKRKVQFISVSCPLYMNYVCWFKMGKFLQVHRKKPNRPYLIKHARMLVCTVEVASFLNKWTRFCTSPFVQVRKFANGG